MSCAGLFFSPTILIDGNFSDWTGVSPVYSGPSGTDGAADFKDIYIYNDANYYYFRVTLWHDIPSANGFFPKYCNLFFDTDGVPATGYFPVTGGPNFGSEMLQQSSSTYQEKNGNFNDGVPLVGLTYLMAPTTREASFPADFEWRYSRSATFGGGGSIFSTNRISVVFLGQTPGFQPTNFAPPSGGDITYTNATPTVCSAPAVGPTSRLPRVPGGNVALVWDTSGTLQVRSGLSDNNSWTNLPTATSPYVLPASSGGQFFRLAK